MAVDAYTSKKQVQQELGGLLEAAAEDARGGVAEEAGEEVARLREEQRVVQLKLSVLSYHAAVYATKQVAEEQGDEQAKMLAQQIRRRRPQACRWRAREDGWSKEELSAEEAGGLQQESRRRCRTC